MGGRGVGGGDKPMYLAEVELNSVAASGLRIYCTVICNHTASESASRIFETQ